MLEYGLQEKSKFILTPKTCFILTLFVVYAIPISQAAFFIKNKASLDIRRAMPRIQLDFFLKQLNLIKIRAMPKLHRVYK